MRLVDLSGAQATRRRDPEVEVLATPATELLLSTIAVLDESPHEFDVGQARLAELAELAGEDLLTELRELIGDGPKFMMMLLPVLAAAADPGDVDDVLTTLEQYPPAELWSVIVANFADDWADATDDTVRRAAGGDEVARQALYDSACGDENCPAFIRVMLGTDPVELHDRVVRVLRQWRERVLPALEREALPAMQRDAAAKRVLAAEVDLPELVVTATNGLEWSDERGIRRLLLLPSYVFRPWVIVTEWQDTKVIAYPVADEHLALPSTAPPPALVKLFKALGDEGRLRLLQRMQSGPVSLTEAAAELDVSKPTAHHHLSILRQAGLVTISEHGRTKEYALRAEPEATATAALQRYLGRTSEPTDDVAG